MEKVQRFLGREVDNSRLVLFRIGFGLLAMAESWGAIFTGWVRRAFIDVDMTFPFFGFEWLQPLPGYGMYFYYLLMGLSALFIALGFYYRWSTAIFFLLWTGSYLMQKTHYNNHYYLLMVMSFIMILIPAHKANSLDVRFGRVREESRCAFVYIWIWIAQVVIVYLYAAINKVYPDWIAAKPIEIWFASKSDYPVIGPLLAQRWFQYTIAYGGIFYDGIVVFLLSFHRTRMLGFLGSVTFNLFNSFVFHIGIFPYLMILLSSLFYPGDRIRAKFFPKRKPVQEQDRLFPKWSTLVVLIFLAIQVIIPLRHWVIPGDVLWTEEGHRLSWRMMLRAKQGSGYFLVKDGQSGDEMKVSGYEHLTRKQASKVRSHPDMTWQFAQYLKKIYEDKGWKDVEVYAHVTVTVNGGPETSIADPNVDLAKVRWNYFWHNQWITPPQE
ncbi:MAG: HTTM domain-containing protein [Bacteroidota bacterium]